MKKKYPLSNKPTAFDSQKIDYRRKQHSILLLFLGCVCLIFNSCKYSNSPESVARRFLISFNQLDFSTAKSLSTPNTWEILDIMSAATRNVSQDRKNAFNQNFTVTIIKVEKESDTSRLITFQTTPKRLPFNKIRLLRTFNKDGNIRWKVDISTLDLLDSGKLQQTPADILNEDLEENDSTGLDDSVKK